MNSPVLVVVLFAIVAGVQAACTIDPNSNPAAPVLVITESGIKQTYIDNTYLQIRYDSTQQYDSITFSYLGTSGSYGVPECDHVWQRPANLGDPNPASNTNTNYSDTANGANCNIMFVAQFPAATVPSILSKCFAFTTDATYNVYTANVKVTTRQTKPSLRALPIVKVTATNLRFSFRFQKTITVSTNQVSATGNVTVESVVVEQIFNAFAVLDTNNAVLYPAVSTTLRLVTSVQYPYKLAHGTTGSATVTQPPYPFSPFYLDTYRVTPITDDDSAPNAGIITNCTDAPGTICVQVWEVTVTQIREVCDIDTTVGFNFLVICQPGFSGTCVSAQDHSYQTNYHLGVDTICNQVAEDIGLSGTLSPYTSGTNAAAGTNSVGQYIYGQTAYFAADLTTSAGSPSLVSSSVTSVTVTSAGNSAITFSPTAVSNGYISYSYSPNRPAFQFEVNTNTVALSNIDSAQVVTVSATFNVVYQNLQSETRQITLSVPKFALEASTGLDLSADVVVGNAATDSSSTASSSTSLMAIVAGVVGGCVLVAIVAAVVIYRRTTQSFTKELQGQSVKVMQVYVPSPASSSTEMTASAPAPTTA